MAVVVVNERTEAGTPVLTTAESEIYAASNVRLFVEDQDRGDGAVFVTSSRVVWLPSARHESGLAIDFRSIGIHAISRDPESFPHACLYCQIDSEALSEIRFVPAEDCLEQLYQAFNHGASLNPDPEEDAPGPFFDASNIGDFTADGPDIIDPYGDVDEGDDEPEEDGEHDSMDV